MQRRLTALERDILAGIAAALDRYATALWPIGRDNASVRLKIAKQDAEAGLVGVDAARWLKCDTAGDPALRMAISRAYLSLERKGLLERVADGFSESRTTHLRLTDAGREMAKRLTKETSVDG